MIDILEEVLTPRKKQILRAIVEDYIATAEPVSSGSLTNKYGLDFSSATIRNEMAELEHLGYLDKTHTSSGRIPSQKGYRFYVDELIKSDDISMDEIMYIQSKLETKVNEIEDLTKIATTTLSDITHYTTVAVASKFETQIIEEMKFVLLGSRTLMAVILTDNAAIKETIIKFDEDVTDEQVATINLMFNSKFKGKPLSIIDKPMDEFLFSEMEQSISVIKPIIEQLKKAIKDEVYLQGANKSFDLPEFKSMDVVKNFVHIIDEEELVKDVLNSGYEEDINVYIGNENEREELKDFSIITFKHKIGNKEVGTIGIIGPTRMNYSKVISVMKYISKKLKEDDERRLEDGRKE